MRQYLHRLGVVERQFATLPDLFRGPSKTERLQMKSKNNIRTETAHEILHVVVEALHHGRNSDHHRHADDDAEHGQGGPQLIGADSLQRHAHNFLIFALADHRIPLRILRLLLTTRGAKRLWDRAWPHAAPDTRQRITQRW